MKDKQSNQSADSWTSKSCNILWKNQKTTKICLGKGKTFYTVFQAFFFQPKLTFKLLLIFKVSLIVIEKEHNILIYTVICYHWYPIFNLYLFCWFKKTVIHLSANVEIRPKPPDPPVTRLMQKDQPKGSNDKKKKNRVKNIILNFSRIDHFRLKFDHTHPNPSPIEQQIRIPTHNLHLTPHTSRITSHLSNTGLIQSAHSFMFCNIPINAWLLFCAFSIFCLKF